MNRQWLYAKAPVGKITPDTFEWTETAIPVPRDGEALVRTVRLRGENLISSIQALNGC